MGPTTRSKRPLCLMLRLRQRLLAADLGRLSSGMALAVGCLSVYVLRVALARLVKAREQQREARSTNAAASPITGPQTSVPDAPNHHDGERDVVALRQQAPNDDGDDVPVHQQQLEQTQHAPSATQKQQQQREEQQEDEQQQQQQDEQEQAGHWMEDGRASVRQQVPQKSVDDSTAQTSKQQQQQPEQEQEEPDGSSDDDCGKGTAQPESLLDLHQSLVPPATEPGQLLQQAQGSDDGAEQPQPARERDQAAQQEGLGQMRPSQQLQKVQDAAKPPQVAQAEQVQLEAQVPAASAHVLQLQPSQSPPREQPPTPRLQVQAAPTAVITPAHSAEPSVCTVPANASAGVHSSAGQHVRGLQVGRRSSRSSDSGAARNDAERRSSTSSSVRRKLVLADLLKERAVLAAKNEHLRQRLAMRAAPSTGQLGGAADELLESAAPGARSEGHVDAGDSSSAADAGGRGGQRLQRGSGTSSGLSVAALLGDLKAAKAENARLTKMVTRQMDEVLARNAALMQAFNASEARMAALQQENDALRAEVASRGGADGSQAAAQPAHRPLGSGHAVSGGGRDGAPTNGSELETFKETLASLQHRLPPGRGAMSAAGSEASSLHSASIALSAATGAISTAGSILRGWGSRRRGGGAMAPRSPARTGTGASSVGGDLLELLDSFHG